MDPRTFPTKGNLMLAKNSLSLARQGYELMDKKRNILRILFPDADPHMAEGAAVMLFYQVGELFHHLKSVKTKHQVSRPYASCAFRSYTLRIPASSR